MYDDPLAVLEAQLVAAARRRAASARRGWRPSFGAALTAAAASVAVLVAVGAVALLGRHDGRSSAAQTRTAVAEANPGTLHIQRYVSALLGGTPSPALSAGVERQLGLDRYNASEFVTGVVRVQGGVRIRLWEFGVKPARGARIDELAATVDGRVIARASAAQVRRRGLSLIYAGPASGLRLAVVVPNQVVAVGLSRAHALAPVYHNVATFHLRTARPLAALGGLTLVWYGPNGRILERIGPTRP
jgi:hypothetical protein